VSHTLTRRRLLTLPAAALATVAAPWPARQARAQAAGTVVMYTAAPTELQNALIPALRSRLGLTVQVVSAGGGELVKRLQAESGRPMADVVVSVGGEVIDTNAALFTAYRVREADRINPAYLQSGLWTPFSVTVPTVVAVNTQLVPAAEIPTGWADLADPKWRRRIAFGAADRSSSALTQMLQIIHVFGEERGWELFSRMMDNFVILGSSGAVIRGTAQGEYAMCLTLEDNAQRFIDGGAPLRIVYPREGVNASADAMALVTGGPNPAGGRAVLDFLGTAEGQALIVRTSGRRPTRNDVAGPAQNVPFSQLPVKNYPAEWANAKSAEYIRRYLRLARR
jgi:iron(III) transport system substrate-binding protein